MGTAATGTTAAATAETMAFRVKWRGKMAAAMAANMVDVDDDGMVGHNMEIVRAEWTWYNMKALANGQ